MILKIISFLILAPLAVLLVVFCVANREAIDVSFDPIGTMPQFAFQAPLFVLLLCSLILGLLLGGFGTWMSQGHHRTKAANRRREIENLRHELELSNERMRRLREERDRELAAAQGPALAAPTQGHGARALAGPSVAA